MLSETNILRRFSYCGFDDFSKDSFKIYFIVCPCLQVADNYQ